MLGKWGRATVAMVGLGVLVAASSGTIASARPASPQITAASCALGAGSLAIVSTAWEGTPYEVRIAPAPGNLTYWERPRRSVKSFTFYVSPGTSPTAVTVTLHDRKDQLLDSFGPVSCS